MLCCEHQLEIHLFNACQLHEYITPPCSYDLLMDHDVSSYSYVYNQMSYKGVNDSSLPSLMITRDALGGDMILDDAPLLASLSENDESEKLVVKASCDFIVVSKDIFIEEKYSLEENPLEESCDEEVIEVIPHDLNKLMQSLLSILICPFPLLSSFPFYNCFTCLYIP